MLVLFLVNDKVGFVADRNRAIIEHAERQRGIGKNRAGYDRRSIIRTPAANVFLWFIHVVLVFLFLQQQLFDQTVNVAASLSS